MAIWDYMSYLLLTSKALDLQVYKLEIERATSRKGSHFYPKDKSQKTIEYKDTNLAFQPTLSK